MLEGGARKVEHYASADDAANDVVQVDPLSDYEIARPASGRGVNLDDIAPYQHDQTRSVRERAGRPIGRPRPTSQSAKNLL